MIASYYSMRLLFALCSLLLVHGAWWWLVAGGLRCIFSFDGTPAREPVSERRIVL